MSPNACAEPKSDAPISQWRRPALLRGMLQNLFGLGTPLGAALIAIPLLNRRLGTDKMGFLLLAWSLTGYFSLFDLGIGRALTKLFAEKVGANEHDELGPLFWTGNLLMLALGGAAMVAMGGSAAILVQRVLKIPVGLQEEAVRCAWLLAISLPFVVMTAGLRGVLEAQGRFLASNVIRAPLGMWLFLGPALASLFSTSLVWAVAALLAGRVAGWTAYAWACAVGSPSLRWPPRFERRLVASLLRFGGWMTVSNIASPLMTYLDRFMLGTLVSLQAVNYYATPFEVVTKALLIPGALVTVLFPSFSGLLASGGDAGRLYRVGTRLLALGLFPVLLATALFAHEGLAMWLGPSFSPSERVLQILALGVLLNGVANVPFALVQAAGRPDLTAKLHLVELPIYVWLVLKLTGAFGIIGTAVAWSLRVAIDLFLLESLARLQLGKRALPSTRYWATTTLAVASFMVAFLPVPLAGRAAVVGVALVASTAAAWKMASPEWTSPWKRKILAVLRPG